MSFWNFPSIIRMSLILLIFMVLNVWQPCSMNFSVYILHASNDLMIYWPFSFSTYTMYWIGNLDYWKINIKITYHSPLFSQSCGHYDPQCSQHKSVSCRCCRNASLILSGEKCRNSISSASPTDVGHSPERWNSLVISWVWKVWQ